MKTSCKRRGCGGRIPTSTRCCGNGRRWNASRRTGTTRAAGRAATWASGRPCCRPSVAPGGQPRAPDGAEPLGDRRWPPPSTAHLRPGSRAYGSGSEAREAFVGMPPLVEEKGRAQPPQLPDAVQQAGPMRDTMSAPQAKSLGLTAIRRCQGRSLDRSTARSPQSRVWSSAPEPSEAVLGPLRVSGPAGRSRRCPAHKSGRNNPLRRPAPQLPGAS